MLKNQAFLAFWLPIVVCTVGILLNTLSIVVLSIDVSFKRTTRFLLQMLAVADILFLACTGSITVVTMTGWNGMTPLDAALLSSVPMAASVWTVVIVTGERYVAITHPLHAAQYITTSMARKSVIGIWIESVIFSAPRLFELFMEYFSLEITIFYSVAYHVILHSLVILVIPLAILIFFNYHLIRAVRRHAAFVREYATEMSTIRGGQHHQHQQPVTGVNEIRATVTMIAVVIVFIVCQLPLAVEGIALTCVA